MGRAKLDVSQIISISYLPVDASQLSVCANQLPFGARVGRPQQPAEAKRVISESAVPDTILLNRLGDDSSIPRVPNDNVVMCSVKSHIRGLDSATAKLRRKGTWFRRGRRSPSPHITSSL